MFFVLKMKERALLEEGFVPCLSEMTPPLAQSTGVYIFFVVVCVLLVCPDER